MCEYVDHLHEHFKYPVVIEKASYMPPKVSLAREASPGSAVSSCCTGSRELDPRAQSFVSLEFISSI